MARATASPVHIRRAAQGEAEIMAAIHAAAFARSWDAASMARFLAAPCCLTLLAASNPGSQAEGLLIARSTGEEAELLTLAVVPACRGRGIARALLEAAISALGTAGAKQLFLEVDEANAPAVHLYQALGAIVIGRRPRYYEHGADAVIFSLAL
jgi:[ribosomal protein S18]-alanine N-acetyltransferase